MSDNEIRFILGAVKDITIANLSNCSYTPCQENGQNVAEFMQEIYNKLVELNNSAAN